MKNLRNLHAYDNQLTSLPNEIGKLQKLTKLYVNHNRLTTIPEEVGNLSNLIVFQANSNQLKEIPSKIGYLKNLITLEIDDNHFEKELKGIRTVELLKYFRFVAELRGKAKDSFVSNSLLLEFVLVNNDDGHGIPHDVYYIKKLVVGMFFYFQIFLCTSFFPYFLRLGHRPFHER